MIRKLIRKLTKVNGQHEATEKCGLHKRLGTRKGTSEDLLELIGEIENINKSPAAKRPFKEEKTNYRLVEDHSELSLRSMHSHLFHLLEEL